MLNFISRLLLPLILLGCLTTAHSYGVYEDHPYEYMLKNQTYKYSEQYVISAVPKGFATTEPTYPGIIKKSAFRIRTNYDLSDKKGWQATGITRLLSVGALYPWAIDIDIYDTRSVKIGLIYGNIATLESAKFDLYSYDESGNAKKVAVAIANADFTHFSITYPDNYLPIAEITRHANTQIWIVTVNTPQVIDDRIIRIFSGFVVDYEDKFLSK